MTRSEYLENVTNLSVDSEKVALVEKEYGFEIETQLHGVVSNADKSIEFDDGGRTLTLDEILNAGELFNCDFKKLGVIPFMMTGEDEFKCYDGIGKFYYTLENASKYKYV